MRHYSRCTEEAYVHWIRRFLLFHTRRHPRELAEGDANRFPTHLAVSQNVAASTQNHALAAVLFLYEHVLEQPLNRIEGVVRASRPKRLPVVLTRDEVEAVLAQVDGVPRSGKCSVAVFRHCPICTGCTWYCAANWLSVRSPRIASTATLALNFGLYCFRVVIASPCLTTPPKF